MFRFILKSGIFLLLLALSAYMVFLAEKGGSDAFYGRFTTPKQGSLILGNSRAAQGLIPAVMNMELSDDCHYPLYNYSFTIGHSPFGKAYLESIKKKLLSGNHKGIFIISVDPWSVCINRRYGETDSIADNRPGLFLGKMENVSKDPNLDYLLNYYPRSYYEILLRRVRAGNAYLHGDGWLEISLDMDSANITSLTERKINLYRGFLDDYHFSTSRFMYLEKTINYLRGFGEVYLVRLPVDKEILSVENMLIDDFNEKLTGLANRQNVPYLDLTAQPGLYRYTDGNHLHKSSARTVSKDIAHWIMQQHSPAFVVSH